MSSRGRRCSRHSRSRTGATTSRVCWLGTTEAASSSRPTPFNLSTAGVAHRSGDLGARVMFEAQASCEAKRARGMPGANAPAASCAPDSLSMRTNTHSGGVGKHPASPTQLPFHVRLTAMATMPCVAEFRDVPILLQKSFETGFEA
jgi:hypothetical protein